MATALITICYKQVLDASSKTAFAEHVRQVSYQEFLVRSKSYNKDRLYTRFSEMKENDTRATTLHYKTGFAIAGHIEQLEKKMPGVTDTTGNPILFHSHKLEVIESDINDEDVHTIAIYYTTDILTLIDNFGEKLLLSQGDKRAAIAGEYPITDTFLLEMQRGLTISSYTSIQQ